MTSGATGWTPRTSTVFCTVIAVIAVIPCTPQRANALRSAWMPAPPPESDPAIDSTARTGRSDIAVHGSPAWPSRGGQVAAVHRPSYVAEHLQLRESRERLPHAQAG